MTLNEFGIQKFTATRIGGKVRCSVLWNQPPTRTQWTAILWFASSLLKANEILVDEWSIKGEFAV